VNRSRPLAADSRAWPEVANASTTVIGMDFIPRQFGAHLTATARAVTRVESFGSYRE
jgi:hypothetical protein